MTLASLVKTFSDKFTRATGSLTDELARMRQAITTTRDQLHDTARGRLPLDEVVATVIPAVVAQAAEHWKKLHGNALISWRLDNDRGDLALCSPDVKGSRHLPWEIDQPIPWAAVALADPGAAAGFLEALVRAVPYPEGLPSAERPAVIARLTAELAELESAEEHFVDEANAAGVVIAHRPDVAKRRQHAEAMRKIAADSAADRAAQEAAINARHQARRPKTGLPSSYLVAENTTRHQLRREVHEAVHE